MIISLKLYSDNLKHICSTTINQKERKYSGQQFKINVVKLYGPCNKLLEIIYHRNHVIIIPFHIYMKKKKLFPFRPS